MALQDLTPQLRTRLSRMERAVGWFVMLALGLLAFGFVYYVYNTAERKGWFVTKAPYFAFVKSASGLKVGDPVMLMGFNAGTITEITPMPAYQFDYNVCVKFELTKINSGYMWTEGSRARVAAADLLGKRVLEVTKGTGGYPTYIFFPLRWIAPGETALLPNPEKWELAQELMDPHGTNLLAQPRDPVSKLASLASEGIPIVLVMNIAEDRKSITGIWNDKAGRYDPYTNNVSRYWLMEDESPAVTEQIQSMVAQVQQALPHLLELTNQLTIVLSNSAQLTSNLNLVALLTQPVVGNLTTISSRLDRPGALGEWLLPTNLNRQLETTLGRADQALGSADSTLASARTNLTDLVSNLARSLDNVANLTSNLSSQVQANTNLLGEISQTIVHADQFVQGLKNHWLLRSAFREPKTNAPPRNVAPVRPLPSPKERP